MPVVSPSRYNSDNSSTSYRSIDKPFYRSTSTSYTIRSYSTDYKPIDREFRSSLNEGRRERKSSFTDYPRSVRAPSNNDDRYRSERSESRSRDVSTTRNDSNKERNGKRSLNSSVLGMTTQELYNKYSPANYVPLTQRLAAQNGEISRSKSISNDILGRPPTVSEYSTLRRGRNSTSGSTINERTEPRRSYKESSPTISSYKRHSLTNGSTKDGNGNEVTPSVSEIRKRFDRNMTVTKLPANENKNNKSIDQYLDKLKNVENGTGYNKINPVEVAPVHAPKEKNGTKWESCSESFDSQDDNVTATFTARLPDRLASIKNQLDPNNPIGKILEKSTVIHVENGDETKKNGIVSDLEKQGLTTPHYIKKSQPVVSTINDLSYIDEKSPTGFENKLFDHGNFAAKSEEEIEDKMQTSSDSAISELTESSERKSEDKSIEDIKEELAGGRGTTTLRRSSERSADLYDARTSGSSRSSGLNGLRNIGNTCFMNSVVQCLSNTRPLQQYLLQERYADEINTTLSCMKGALIKAFASVIKELWQAGSSDSVVNTTAFKSQIQRFAPRFMGYSQQDAQEFLRYLLEGLHEDVNLITVKPAPILTEIDDELSESAKAVSAWSRYTRREQSRVADIFVGQLKSTLRCTKCGHDSVTFDPFWDLSLPIPTRTGTLKLQQCLQHFTKEEELDGDEKPTCSKCGVRRKCLKWFTVQKFPQVLVVHLKRFSPTERFRGKLNVLVEAPLTGLDMSPYASTGAENKHASYDLYAVSNHSGTTYSGHYTAYCKHPYTGDWHEYNDSRVSKINPRDVVTSEAYVLFYEMSKS